MYSVDCAVCATGHTVAVVKRNEQKSGHRHGFLYTREAFLVEYCIFCYLICMEINVPKIANKRHRQRVRRRYPAERYMTTSRHTHTRARVNFLNFLFLFTLFTRWNWILGFGVCHLMSIVDSPTRTHRRLALFAIAISIGSRFCCWLFNFRCDAAWVCQHYACIKSRPCIFLLRICDVFIRPHNFAPKNTDDRNEEKASTQTNQQKSSFITLYAVVAIFKRCGGDKNDRRQTKYGTKTRKKLLWPNTQLSSVDWSLMGGGKKARLASLRGSASLMTRMWQHWRIRWCGVSVSTATI